VERRIVIAFAERKKAAIAAADKQRRKVRAGSAEDHLLELMVVIESMGLTWRHQAKRARKFVNARPYLRVEFERRWHS
jgi:hypothetical protein